MDKVKGMFGGGLTGKFVDKLIGMAESEITNRVVNEIKAASEVEARAKVKEMAIEVMRPKLVEITSQDPTGIATKMGDEILNSAAEKIVDKVWDKVKDKIVKKVA